MTAGKKNLFYVKYLADEAIYKKIVSDEGSIALTRLENDSPAPVAGPVLAAAHAYQVGASRDELAPHFHVTKELLAQCPKLLVVSSNGAGYDTVDVGACTEAGVLVVNQAGGNAQSVAEHALGMMLSLSKRIVEVDKALRREGPFDRVAFKGGEVFGKTVGIIGIGHVGSRLAAMCKSALGMTVLAYDPYVGDNEIAARGAKKVELDQLLKASDFVSINCPLTAESRSMIGEAQFAMMKPTAMFVTTARGSIHDEKALEEALRAKKIAGAGLDVWEKEPPPSDHPLMAFDNVFVSPHTAGVTHDARCNMAKIAAEQVIAALAGERPPRVVNPDVWPAYARRFAKEFGRAPG
ncbi:hydroxyacid dehydrogenase [Bradyrhizobium sp. LHD-71]|uniref:hydroxyacid dehydrogenase n=1 Tax=Bradyrhizobium sp. LHD-71 TaxID=3072141 RepID=UPI00280FB110|nr:hydroxyacid dehydrogenase [Bradyrhizobium sp. LHD-71]MDQ8732503.1 hydroxyacid dehydrogenase [Bradyrhizobium sp. LHD-71]